MVFSNSSTRAGIVEMIDDTVGSNSNSYPITSKTRDINLALDKVFSLIFQVGGTWQFDDSNHTDYPIITTNLVAGQRDYSFTTDEQGNLILEIHKVLISDENGNFSEISPSDQQSDAPRGFLDGKNVQGRPFTYDKTANGIFLEQIPNYSYTGGLKILISRTGSYFVTTDTIKKPGFSALFHEYLVLRPSYQYAFRNSLPQVVTLKNEMIEMENSIMEHYKSRSKDEQKFIHAVTRSAR